MKHQKPYFDLQSLKNRLNAGKDSLQEALRLLVTTQELIGKEICDYQAQLGDKPAQFAHILLEGQRATDSSVYPEWEEFLLDLLHNPKSSLRGA